MRLKGGLLNGSLAAVYGAAGFIPLFMTMGQHRDMQTACYVLAVAGILLAVYWLVTGEAMGIPVLLIGIVFAPLGYWAEHVALQIGSAGLGVAAFVIAVTMLARALPVGAESVEGR
ncbi:MAG: hypothetical protein IBX61_03250 [Thermoleophilia bacterium]|nr:hypothetical protein [Thermoleophilia bacterium]